MASLIFKNVYINDQETVVGPYENNGILNFNNSIKDFYGDEKSFEKVNDSFVSYLEALGEVDISDDYKVEFSTETLEDSFKKAIITVRYDVNGEEKSITINKLKVKEK